jgi:hypothetical protein
VNFRNLMIVSAVLALTLGIAFVLIPESLASLYGLTLTPAGTFIARLLGVEFVGYGLLAWFVRNAVDSEIRRAILLAFFITDGTGFIVALLGQLSGITNLLGWSIVGVYLLLALGFGYFRFVYPSAS